MKKSILKSAGIILVSVVIFSACKSHDAKKTKSETAMSDTTAQKATENSTETKSDEKDSTKSETKGDVNKIPLTVNVTNLKSKSATVVIGVYGPKNKFLDEKDQLKEYRFKPKNGKLSAKITDLAFGEFGMAIYQDVDGDGKIDKNLIGIPKEPYAFSKNYKPTIKAPSFNDCKFNYSAKANTVNMKLIN